jgi:hypothetical protein
MPSIVKDATVGAALEQVGSAVVDAAAHRGFDAADSHLSRTPITVDKEGWDALSEELGALHKRIQEIEAESRRRMGTQREADGDGATPGEEAAVVLMLFHSAPGAEGQHDGSAAPAPRKRRAATKA